MRNVMVVFVVILGMAALLNAQVPAEIVRSLPPEVAEHGFADLVLLNGKVVSMDDAGNNDNPGSIYEAMAVKKDRIMALGPSQRIGRMASSSTRVIDLKGKTVIPGIIDTHSHIYRVQRFADQLDIKLPFSLSIPEGDTVEATRVNILNAIREASRDVPPGEWIVAGMVPNPKNGATNAVYWARDPKKMAHREFLDGATSNHPVLLRARTRGFVNSRGLELANEHMPGFSDFIDQSMSSQSSTMGHLGSQEMGSITWAIFFREEPIEKLAEAIRLNLEMAAAAGWTTFSSRIPMPTIMSAFVHLDRNGKMPIRLAAHFEPHRRAAPPEFTRAFYKQTGALWGLGSDHLWITGVASERWDSLGPDACLGPDISAPPEIKARERCQSPGSLFWDVLKNAILAGWRPAGVHGVGSHGVRLFTQLLDEVVAETNWTAEDIRKLRPTVEHGMVIGTEPDVIEKLKEYGIIVSLGPGLIAQGTRLVQDYGEGLEKFVVPTKSLLDAGIKVTGQLEGSYSVGYHFWTLITRKIGNSYVNLKEAVDRVRVLKMWTRWAGDYVFREEDLGSLEEGKLADFVILDKDYFTIPVDDIPSIVPMMTVVGGETKFLNRDLAQELGLQTVGYQTTNPRPWDADQRARADMR